MPTKAGAEDVLVLVCVVLCVVDVLVVEGVVLVFVELCDLVVWVEVVLCGGEEATVTVFVPPPQPAISAPAASSVVAISGPRPICP